jgi:hypothetical protein
MSSSRVHTLLSILLLMTVALSGCVDVELIDRSASDPASGLSSEQKDPDQHDLAILAVDFDPPLNYEDIMACKSRGEGITLLVAVENTGVTTEQNVMVQASLSERSSDRVYVEKQGMIETISPGEIKIVQLHDTDIPFSTEYKLSVAVVPVAGEIQTDDNSRTYDLLITRS